MGAMTLCLDKTWKPYTLISMKEAVSALVESMMNGDNLVEALEVDETRRFRNPSGLVDIPAPLVIIRYDHYDEYRSPKARFSKRAMFARDNFTCQYCGKQATPATAFRELTVDHVKPQYLFPSRNAATTYENTATACYPCNNRKGGKTPAQANMTLRSVPRVPTYEQIKFGGNQLKEAQRQKVAEYFGCEASDVF